MVYMLFFRFALFKENEVGEKEGFNSTFDGKWQFKKVES